MPAIMTSRQASELDHALERNGFTADDVKRLSKGDMLSRILGVLRGRAEIVIKSILERVGVISLAEQPRFVARDHFKKDTSASAKVRFASMWHEFEDNFLGKIEEAVPEAELAIYRPTGEPHDYEILDMLGEKAETTLSQFWACLARQGSGQLGELLTDGYQNVFYIRDAKGELWAVFTDWSDTLGGWGAAAMRVTGMGGRGNITQVIARK